MIVMEMRHVPIFAVDQPSFSFRFVEETTSQTRASIAQNENAFTAFYPFFQLEGAKPRSKESNSCD